MSMKGALWFRTTRFGDEKDRVMVKEDGTTTYFASDIAYHREKFSRGFARVIDIWGADHHGYVPRMTGVLQALGIAPEGFSVILVQMVNLLRGGVPGCHVNALRRICDAERGHRGSGQRCRPVYFSHPPV